MHQIVKKTRGKRDEKLAKVTELWSKASPVFDLWTDLDEEGLKNLKEMKIEMKDTALGRYQAQEKQRACVAIDNMDNNERADILKHLLDLEEDKKLAAEMDGAEAEEAAQDDGTQAPC